MSHIILKIFGATSRRLKINNVSSMCTLWESTPTSTKETTWTKSNNVPNELMTKIISSDSCNQILKIASQHSQIFDKKHVVRTMHSLFNFAKNDPEIKPIIINHPAFESLCLSIKKHSRTMTMNEIVSILKDLSFLDVPGNSAIYQILLQLIKLNINHLELNQIIFLDFILQKCQSNHLADALKLALPLVFQIQLGMQIDHNNLSHLISVLRYCTKNNIPKNSINKVITCLQLQSENLNHESAETILRSISLLQLTRNDGSILKLVSRCFDVMSENFDKVSYDTIIRTLNIIKDRFIKDKNDCFYNTRFLCNCANYAINHNIGFDNSIQIIKVLCRLRFNSVELTKHISDMITSNLSLIDTPFNYMTYVNCLSNNNFKPDNWDTIWEYIRYLKKNVKRYDIPWIRFCRDLAVLDSYDDDLLKTVLEENFLNEYMAKHSTTMDFIQLLNVYQGIRINRPSLKISVPQEYINSAMEFNFQRSVNESFKYSLELALGGQQYFASNVKLPYGLFVDHFIGYRDGKYPVAIHNITENRVINYGELDIDNCKQTICIVCFTKGCYSVNMEVLKGQFDLTLKMLERLGHQVISIPIERWLDMPECEKIPFIMREINYKLEEKIENTNVVI